MSLSPMKEDVAQYKKELILRAACEMFFRNGYTATTTDALTERLSISKTMIYQHFRSKLEMLSTICERAVSLSVAVAAEAALMPGPADERLRRLVHDFTLVVIEHHEWIALSYRESQTPPPDVRQRIVDKQEEFDRILRTLIEDGVASGKFHVPDPAATALAIGGMIIWVHSWYRASGRLTPQEIAETFTQSALLMVGAAMPGAAER